jgi:hypothetical protein
MLCHTIPQRAEAGCSTEYAGLGCLRRFLGTKDREHLLLETVPTQLILRQLWVFVVS